MTSLIEQAAKRLEQLRAAGVEAPVAVGDEPAPRPPVSDWSPPSAPQARAPQASPVHATPVSRLVEIDLAGLAEAGFVTPGAARTLQADQYRVIKRPLITNAIGKGAETLKHGNLIMITSALSGEGKTYTSINLAMSIAAELDHTVMLVDADVARPSALRMMGLPPGPGLLDVLEGKAELPDVLLRTNVDKLTLMPAGTHHPRATELLASEAMNSLLEDMATRYPDRIIIFDSPPLLLTTEARALATHMGQIVMVVHAGRTLQADVKHALSTIESCPVRMLVLNRAAGETHGAYGGYGYGYGYGYGRGYGADQGETGQTPAPQTAGAAAG